MSNEVIDFMTINIKEYVINAYVAFSVNASRQVRSRLQL